MVGKKSKSLLFRKIKNSPISCGKVNLFFNHNMEAMAGKHKRTVGIYWDGMCIGGGFYQVQSDSAYLKYFMSPLLDFGLASKFLGGLKKDVKQCYPALARIKTDGLGQRAYAAWARMGFRAEDVFYNL